MIQYYMILYNTRMMYTVKCDMLECNASEYINISAYSQYLITANEYIYIYLQ